MPVDLERRDHVALVTLNRPDALNAMSPDMFDDLEARLDEIEADESIRAVVLTGAGEKAFCAGADISTMRTADAQTARAWGARGQGMASRIENLPAPVIAAVNGYALGGGCELALACDIRICVEKARFGQPEVSLGIPPGWGGTQRLARTTSMGFAKEVVLTGRMVGAEEALRTGLVTHVHPPGELLDAALALAGQIAAKGRLAVAETKRLCNLALGDLPAGLARELDAFALAFGTEDQREGMDAFFEKRTPRFSGLDPA